MKYTNSQSEQLQAIGVGIRLIRASKGYSQEAFARHAGLNCGYYGGVERGERNISALNLIKISKALNAPVSEFFKGIK